MNKRPSKLIFLHSIIKINFANSCFHPLGTVLYRIELNVYNVTKATRILSLGTYLMIRFNHIDIVRFGSNESFINDIRVKWAYSNII